MSSKGFGHNEFGSNPFGHLDWTRIVLWDELPPEVRRQDRDAGYPYRDFVFSLCPSFLWLKNHVDRFKYLDDPNKIRLDLLKYLGENFGIDVDLEQPEAYQRMRVQIAGRWNIIKGKPESYVVLCRVHGFEVEVKKLWWNGESYVENSPEIYLEEPTFEQVDLGGGHYEFKIWLNCKPIEPGSLSLTVDSTVLTDDGDGNIVGTSGTIDYGWGYIYLEDFSASSSATIRADYDSKVGGCINVCGRCLTHRLRLIITVCDVAGQDEITIEEAFKRMWKKLNKEVKPVHVEFEPIYYFDSGYLSIAYRYDIIPADEVPTDTGLHIEVV